MKKGFGLSSSPILNKRGAGCDVVLPKASGYGQGWCLNRCNSMGPATDSLDHRARACYLPSHGFSYNKYCHARQYALTLGSPPSALLKYAPYIESIKAYIVLKQKWMILRSLINSHAGPETQWLNIVFS